MSESGYTSPSERDEYRRDVMRLIEAGFVEVFGWVGHARLAYSLSDVLRDLELGLDPPAGERAAVAKMIADLEAAS